MKKATSKLMKNLNKKIVDFLANPIELTMENEETIKELCSGDQVKSDQIIKEIKDDLFQLQEIFYSAYITKDDFSKIELVKSADNFLIEIQLKTETFNFLLDTTLDEVRKNA